jgi:hypothetical protein
LQKCGYAVGERHFFNKLRTTKKNCVGGYAVVDQHFLKTCGSSTYVLAEVLPLSFGIVIADIKKNIYAHAHL